MPEGFWAQEGLENYLGLWGFILIKLGTIRSDQTCIFMLGGCPILEHSYSYIALTITITIAMWHGDCHGNSHRNSHGYMSDMSDMSDTSDMSDMSDMSDVLGASFSQKTGWRSEIQKHSDHPQKRNFDADSSG